MLDNNAKFKELKQKAEKANLAGIKINAEIDNAKNNLERLLIIAKQKFGTDNLEELEKKLVQLQEQNNRILADLETNVLLAEKDIQEKTALINKIKQEN